MNNAIIGEGSIVAAGAVVLENFVAPPNSLIVGVPAKIKKTGCQNKAMIQRSAEHYVVDAKRYKR